MPARLVQVTILNNSDYPIVWQDDGRDHGFWQEPWYPSNIKNLKKGEQASFRLESGGIATGVQGWVLFKVDVPAASNVGARAEFFRLDFERAYIEVSPFQPPGFENHYLGPERYTLKDPRTDDAPHPAPALAYVRDHGSSDIANIDSSPFEFVAAIPGAPFTAPIFLIDDAIAKHVAWFVSVNNVGTSATSLRVATSELIYAVTPRIEATLGSTVLASDAATLGGAHVTPASGGDLIWFRHDGRLDGTFNWEGPEKVGNRWDELVHVFPGDPGIVYGVTPRVEATLLSTGTHATADGGHSGGGFTPASGGDLMWFRHIGRDDGSFRWEGPRRVGTRWDVFKHVFAGGDGIIYGIHENGDLMWYRHVGRNDGSFVWEGPKKVGTGWGQFTHVFSGGDGILYAITPRLEAGVHATGGATPASGGDLLWFRHLGREDGSFEWEGGKTVGARWDGLKHVFSAGDGIIYGVTSKIEASLLSIETHASAPSGHPRGDFKPASGGDLMWYRHTGRADGSFRWEGPKKVGTGWGELTHVFCGGASTD